MPEEQTVIYTARTAQDAHLLKHLLDQHQIKAVVLGDAIDGLASTALGWAASPQVAVTAEDAERARQMAVEFDQELAASAAAPVAADPQPVAEGPALEPPAGVPGDWPTCPGCGERRSTRCAVCGTAGTDFQPADMGFTWIPGLEDAAAAAPSCGCGPGGCTPAGQMTGLPTADESQAEQPARLLMCPTCDEPFTPEYPRMCEWCGHDFGEGHEVELPGPPEEEINSRVIAVIVGLVVLAVAMVVYLMFMVR